MRFFVYEEYGAKYESMLQNMAALARSMPKWSAYERGIEALVNSLVPQGIGAEGSKKGLTYEDLLIKVLALYLLDWGLELNHSNKPIQRVCRYPLLFADLCMHTPITDGLESSSAIEKVLSRLRETAKEINKATNDEKTQARIQRSWHLQDLLVFPELVSFTLFFILGVCCLADGLQILAPVSLRLLGHALLCGVLYVAYQSKNGDLRGDYMLCASFKSYLLLALPKQGMSPFEIMAIINHSDIEVVKADSGRGK